MIQNVLKECHYNIVSSQGFWMKTIQGSHTIYFSIIPNLKSSRTMGSQNYEYRHRYALFKCLNIWIFVSCVKAPLHANLPNRPYLSLSVGLGWISISSSRWLIEQQTIIDKITLKFQCHWFIGHYWSMITLCWIVPWKRSAGLLLSVSNLIVLPAAWLQPGFNDLPPQTRWWWTRSILVSAILSFLPWRWHKIWQHEAVFWGLGFMNITI